MKNKTFKGFKEVNRGGTMTQYFYFWKLKNNPKSNWVAYSVAHNPQEVKIVEKTIKKLRDKFEFKREKGVKLK